MEYWFVVYKQYISILIILLCSITAWTHSGCTCSTALGENKNGNVRGDKDPGMILVDGMLSDLKLRNTLRVICL